MTQYYSGYSDYFEQIALGKVPQRSSIYKFGRIEGLGATTSIVAPNGIYGTPPTAEPVTISSTDAGDAPAGAGARELKIIGLNGDWEMIEETVAIDVVTTNSFIRVFRAQVTKAGTISPIPPNANIGTITITQQTSLIDMIAIEPGKGQTLCACYTIPKDYKGLVWDADATASEGKNVNFRIVTRVNNGNAEEPYRVAGERDAFENSVQQNFIIPSVLDEKEDIIFVATSSASGANLSATFLIELVEI